MVERTKETDAWMVLVRFEDILKNTNIIIVVIITIYLFFLDQGLHIARNTNGSCCCNDNLELDNPIQTLLVLNVFK